VTVLCPALDLLPTLLFSNKNTFSPHCFISIAFAEEASPSEPASQVTSTAVPAEITRGTTTVSSPHEQGQGLAPSAPAPEGQPQAPPAAAPSPQKPEESKPQEGFVDTMHGELSHRIQNTAAWLDSFFTNESFIKEENHSYVLVRYDVFKESGSPATMKPSFDLRLALPRLERKSHLVFTAEPAEPPVGSPTPAPAKTAGENFGAPDQRTVTAGVNYIFRSAVKESFIVRSGMQFNKFTPVLFGAPRYRALFPLDSWNMRFTQEALWRTDSGWQTDTRLDFEHLFPHDLFFRTSLDGVWTAHVDGYLFSLAFSLRQTLNPTHAVDYELINIYRTKPVGELTEVDYRIRYRHNFWRSWLFFEVSPQVRFPQNRNFRSLPGILFRIEMFIGETG
jgi:hypothetical protein